jgi:ATP-binding cassette subfamily B protein/subfamily B ATP-binding cassette protein MsbA
MQNDYSSSASQGTLKARSQAAQNTPQFLLQKYARLIRYMWRQWPAFVLILTLTSVSALISALQPWPMKLLVDYALGQIPIPQELRLVFASLSLQPTPSSLIFAAALASLGLFVLNSALDVGLSWAWTAAGQRMVYDLAADLFHRLQRLSQLFHQQRTVGDSLSRLTDDTWCIYKLTDSILVTPGRQFITLATIGAVAYRLDARLALISLLVGPALAASAWFFGRRLKHRARLNREAQSRLLSFVQQTLTALPIVQAFASQTRNAQQFQRLAADAVTISQRNTLSTKSYELVNGFFLTCGAAIILFFGSQRVLAGALSVGSLLVFLAYLKTLHSAAQTLLTNYGNLKSVEASIDRVLEILDVKEAVHDAPGATILPTRSRPLHSVSLENVTFGYEAGRPVLHNVSLEAKAGETLALVGATGAGKSTLVSLIPRFFDPWEGRVTIDGIDMRDIQLESLRTQIGIVLQEPFLLPLTVAENIAYGCPGASRDEIEAAAHAANAHEFIERLPEGYEAVIGERGAGFSGGEQQRLAIARALLKDAPILILDEPTSALDARTEALVIEALERLRRGRTTFIIAHRLSTIRMADRIIVLAGGRIVETGLHDELVTAGGLYHRLHSAQSGNAPQVVTA